ncbi:MAG: zinc ribbon domain-containing protein [Ilumatobacteraceae bacterium]
MRRQCQSCGMPLTTRKAGDCRGLERDGSRSEKWCSLCYVNGGFVDPDCSLESMTRIIDSSLVEAGHGRVMRWMARRQLPRLDRWRAHTTSSPT